MMGFVAVATIIATGIINSWFLVGSPTALVKTTYGRLLLAKIGVVTVMVGIAAINRFYLTPRLRQPWARDRLARNSLAEAALGAMAIAIVGALGTLPPAGATHSEEHLGHMH